MGGAADSGECVALFQEVCNRDLERIVAKLANAAYEPDAPTWAKIKNKP